MLAMHNHWGCQELPLLSSLQGANINRTVPLQLAGRRFGMFIKSPQTVMSAVGMCAPWWKGSQVWRGPWRLGGGVSYLALY